MKMITGSGPATSMGRKMLTDTEPDGPPGAVIIVLSVPGTSISGLCTSSTVFRPTVGSTSRRNGGSLVASTNAWAAGSRTGLLGVEALVYIAAFAPDAGETVGG